MGMDGTLMMAIAAKKLFTELDFKGEPFPPI